MVVLTVATGWMDFVVCHSVRSGREINVHTTSNCSRTGRVVVVNTGLDLVTGGSVTKIMDGMVGARVGVTVVTMGTNVGILIVRLRVGDLVGGFVGVRVGERLDGNTTGGVVVVRVGAMVTTGISAPPTVTCQPMAPKMVNAVPNAAILVPSLVLPSHWNQCPMTRH